MMNDELKTWMTIERKFDVIVHNDLKSEQGTVPEVILTIVIVGIVIVAAMALYWF